MPDTENPDGDADKKAIDKIVKDGGYEKTSPLSGADGLPPSDDGPVAAVAVAVGPVPASGGASPHGRLFVGARATKVRFGVFLAACVVATAAEVVAVAGRWWDAAFFVFLYALSPSSIVIFLFLVGIVQKCRLHWMHTEPARSSTILETLSRRFGENCRKKTYHALVRIESMTGRQYLGVLQLTKADHDEMCVGDLLSSVLLMGQDINGKRQVFYIPPFVCPRWTVVIISLSFLLHCTALFLWFALFQAHDDSADNGEADDEFIVEKECAWFFVIVNLALVVFLGLGVMLRIKIQARRKVGDYVQIAHAVPVEAAKDSQQQQSQLSS